VVQEFRFWKHKLKLYKGLHVSPQLLGKYNRETAFLEDVLSIHYTFGELVKFIHEAYQEMKTAKKDHRKIRVSYVEE
jgi:hypothetical protein